MNCRTFILITNKKIKEVAWDAFLKDKHEAFGEVYQQYSESLFQFGLSMCQNAELVEMRLKT